MPVRIVRNDITKVKADAIVNTANPKPIIGGGTDSAIYKAAGEEQLLAERQKIGNIAPGQVAYTDAFDLDAKYIIHTVGPSWIDGKHGERDILHSCYGNSLNVAAELRCRSVAFPLIATGVYGFPKDEALQIALSEINRFLLTHDMKVMLVVFDRKSFELSGKLVEDIKEYIDEHTAHEIHESEYYGDYADRRRKEYREYLESDALPYENHIPDEDDDSLKELSLTGSDKASSATSPDPVDAYGAGAKGKNLEEFLDNTGDTFPQRLFKLIDERGMDDVTVYKKANIDRKLFSSIRCKKNYRPKKKTAVAFAIALELDPDTMKGLLSTAEIAFSPSNKFDLIITYFVTNGIYDIYEINAALFKYGEPILGE